MTNTEKVLKQAQNDVNKWVGQQYIKDATFEANYGFEVKDLQVGSSACLIISYYNSFKEKDLLFAGTILADEYSPELVIEKLNNKFFPEKAYEMKNITAPIQDVSSKKTNQEKTLPYSIKNVAVEESHQEWLIRKVKEDIENNKYTHINERISLYKVLADLLHTIV